MKAGVAVCVQLVFAGAACIQQSKTELINATGSAVTVSVPDQASVVIGPEATARFWYQPQLAVAQPHGSWRYVLPPLRMGLKESTRYMESRGFLERVLKLRLDADGKLWVVSPGPQGSHALRDQPPGYPVEPSVESQDLE